MRERSRRASPQSYHSSLSVDPGEDLATKNGSAPTKRFSWVCLIRVHTPQQKDVGHRHGLGCLIEKYQVKRLRTPLRGQIRVSQRRLECLSPVPSEVHSARRQTNQQLTLA